jgi:hypothetical protein
MQNINILPTAITPLAKFETTGNFILRGRSIVPDAFCFYQPIVEWVKQQIISFVKFEINIDYYNTASSKMLFDILKAIDTNDNILKFDVIWHFEEDDEDTLEHGQLLAERLSKARFIYKELIDIQ